LTATTDWGRSTILISPAYSTTPPRITLAAREMQGKILRRTGDGASADILPAYRMGADGIIGTSLYVSEGYKPYSPYKPSATSAAAMSQARWVAGLRLSSTSAPSTIAGSYGMNATSRERAE